MPLGYSHDRSPVTGLEKAFLINQGIQLFYLDLRHALVNATVLQPWWSPVTGLEKALPDIDQGIQINLTWHMLLYGT